MSEIIDNSSQRKEMLKHMILELHKGENVDVLRNQLMKTLKSIPYSEVVAVEQELISSGQLSDKDVLQFCDLHAAVMEGNIEIKDVHSTPPGHPINTFVNENAAIKAEAEKIMLLISELKNLNADEFAKQIVKIRAGFNLLYDVDKHYKRKEYLLFPFLEKRGITGPPKVMWGKHDEIRELLKQSIAGLADDKLTKENFDELAHKALFPALEQVTGMIMKEEQILLPMSIDAVEKSGWIQIYKETPEFGYCLVDPTGEWDAAEEAEGTEPAVQYQHSDGIRLSSGAFSMKELEALFVHLPVDITFVDANDKVRFFSHSPNRVFERNLSILGRDVRMCHPPGSVNIVEQIINDFKSGKENKARFWLSNFMGRFVVIDYVALRSKDGEYLGVVETTQDITELRALEGDQRLLSYTEK